MHRRLTSILALAGLAALLAPAAARAADLTATPSTFASVWSSARGGDRILLASGNYGTFHGGSKSGVVTITPQSGASATLEADLGGSSGIRLDGLTISGLSITGTPHDITVANSTFTGSAAVRGEQLNNSNIVFDHDAFAGINACSQCYEGRLSIVGQGSAPSGVTVENSTFGPGGDAVGLMIGSRGVQVLNNTFTGIRQVDQVHTDSLQLYGSAQTVIRGNYFTNFDTAIMAPDGGDHEQILDNVFLGSGAYLPAIQLGSHVGDVVAHNVIKNIDLHVDAKSGNPPSTNVAVRDNVMVNSTVYEPSSACSGCTEGYDLYTSSGQASGSHTVVGTPVFAGGASPGSWAGYALAAGSPGKGNASDGTDRGIDPAAGGAAPAPTGTTAQAIWKAPSGVVTGKPAVLDGTRSTGAGPLTCTWSFENEDGSTVWETATGCKITKTFANADTKYVTLTLTAADGASSSDRESFAVAAPGASANIATAAGAALVAAYGFNEASGRVAADSAAGAHAASLRGARHTKTARAGRALALHGRGYVRVPAAVRRSLGRQLTLEAWVRPVRRTSARRSVFGQAEALRPSALRLRRWSHVAITYDGARVRLYTDGRQVRSTRAAKSPLGASLVVGRGFTGQIDDVRLYRTALTRARVSADMRGPA